MILGGRAARATRADRAAGFQPARGRAWLARQQKKRACAGVRARAGARVAGTAAGPGVRSTTANTDKHNQQTAQPTNKPAPARAPTATDPHRPSAIMAAAGGDLPPGGQPAETCTPDSQEDRPTKRRRYRKETEGLAPAILEERLVVTGGLLVEAVVVPTTKMDGIKVLRYGSKASAKHDPSSEQYLYGVPD